MSEFESFASFNAISKGLRVFETKSPTKDSSLALVSLRRRCFGPEESAVIYGKLISVC